LRVWTIRPATQQRLPGSTSIKTGWREKNLVGGGLLDLGLDHLVEHLKQLSSALTSLLGGSSQRRNAGDGYRPGQNLQEPPRDVQADPLGLGDAGELVLLLTRDLDGLLEPLLEGLDLSLLVGQLPLQWVDGGLPCGCLDGMDDLSGFAVKRLP
jgi:hypothetical protein